MAPPSQDRAVTGTSGDAVVLALLQTGHLTGEDLIRLARQADKPPAPDHAAFTPMVEASCPVTSLRTYKTTFRRLTNAFGDVPVDAVEAADLDSLLHQIVAAAHERGHADGSGAARGFIHGARFYYRQAVRHRHRSDNPALALALPARRRRIRRALTQQELGDLYRVAASGGSDPALDLLLLDFHRETAARRGGALGLRICDLALMRPSVLLREKGGHEREVPASPELLHRLVAHARARGAVGSNDQVLRYPPVCR
jgi:integrase/recombinase XerC